jgi:dethiobiotin synthetase
VLVEGIRSIESLEMFFVTAAGSPMFASSSSTYVVPVSHTPGGREMDLDDAAADDAATNASTTSAAGATTDAASSAASSAASTSMESSSSMAADDNGSSVPLRDACRGLLASGSCVRLFVAGDKSHCGKTSVALGILGALHASGVSASKLAYIKPATQCEAPDLMQRWCDQTGVAHVEGAQAPLVFFKGFTREFLKGQAGTTAEWIAKVTASVDRLAIGKAFVVVDGVGFPAVGSVVGVSNLEVAKAAKAPVVLVGKCGVGEAIDGYSLNSAYFSFGGVPVLGGIFNRGNLAGFYNHTACGESIRTFFATAKPREAMFGVVPELPVLEGTRESIPSMSDPECASLANACIAHMASHIDVLGLVHAAAADPWNRHRPPSSSSSSCLGGGAGGVAFQPFLALSPRTVPGIMASQVTTPSTAAVVTGGGVLSAAAASVAKKRSRADIEAEAAAMGAVGG